MTKHTVFGVHISERTENVSAVQAVLTKYGCNIRTRLGLHEVSTDLCAPDGLVLVQTTGDAAEVEKLYDELRAQRGVGVQRMDFEA